MSDELLRRLERELGPRHPRVIQARRRAGLPVDWPRAGDVVRVEWGDGSSGLARVLDEPWNADVFNVGWIHVANLHDGFKSWHPVEDMQPVETNPKRRPFTLRKPRRMAFDPDAIAELCLFCGAPAFIDVLDYYPETREFDLDYCCETQRDWWVEDMRTWSPETWQRFFAQKVGLTDVRSVGGDPTKREDLGIGPESEWLMDRGITLVMSQPIKDRLKGLSRPGALARDEIREYVRQVHQHAPEPNAGMLWGLSVYNGPPSDPLYDGKPRFSSKTDGVRPLNLVSWPRTLIGVALIGRPVAVATEKKQQRTGEKIADVTRLALQHNLPPFLTYKAASSVYVAAWEEACRRGYSKVQTFTLESESGMSLRYARYKPVGKSAGGQASRPSRKRAIRSEELSQPKVKWERVCRTA